MSDQGQALPGGDRWETGAAYESYVGRWSRKTARIFLDWLRVPAHSRWVDVGCGTGALTQTILDIANPREVTGIDQSASFVAFARVQVTDEKARFAVGDAQQLPIESSRYDALVSGLALNFIPDKTRAVQEFVRVVKPEGLVTAYVWDYADDMQMMRAFWDTVTTLHPEAVDIVESRRFPICKPEPLAALFQSAGLREVNVRSIDIPTHFRDFNDYWSPFLGGTGSAPTYVLSLSDADRNALRDAIHARLPVSADGSIDLIARAWAVRGRR